MLPGEELLAVAAADVPLRKASAREHAGPCPLCGGTDRFRVSLDRARWFCRQCLPKGGDLVEYLRRVRGLSFREAAAAAGRRLDDPLPRYIPPPKPTPREPSAAWQEAAARVVRRAAATLWDPERGRPGQAYLRRRGLTEETARAFGLGFVPQTVDACGLRAYGPSVVLPWWDGDRLQEVKLRRIDDDDPRRRYLLLTWSDRVRRQVDPAGRPHLFGVDRLRPTALEETARNVFDHPLRVVLVEGELDAVTIAQEAGDLVAPVTFGSAASTPTDRAAELLRTVPRLFLALDPDRAGQDAAERLLCRFPRAELLPPFPVGKDANAFHLAGGSLRDWVRTVCR